MFSRQMCTLHASAHCRDYRIIWPRLFVWIKVSHKVYRRFDHAAGWKKRRVRGGYAYRRIFLGCYCCSKLHACRSRCQLTGQHMDSKRRRSSIQCIVARVSMRVRVRPVERVNLKTASARHRKLELRLRCNRPQVGRCVAVFVCLSPGAFIARPRRCATY